MKSRGRPTKLHQRRKNNQLAQLPTHFSGRKQRAEAGSYGATAGRPHTEENRGRPRFEVYDHDSQNYNNEKKRKCRGDLPHMVRAARGRGPGPAGALAGLGPGPGSGPGQTRTQTWPWTNPQACGYETSLSDFRHVVTKRHYQILGMLLLNYIIIF